MVTTQVVLECEATCGPSVFGIYFSTNRIAAHLEVLPRAISKIRKIRVKRNTNRIAAHLEVLPRAISKIRKIRVKRNNAHCSATH